MDSDDGRLLPPHGRLSCSVCFGGDADWGRSAIGDSDGWVLEHNPCSWGSRNPKFLVLGFSKGERQCKNIRNRQHEDIPFDGFRPRLTSALQVLGLMRSGDTIDAHLRPDEPDWAFGSLVRCSLSLRGKKSGNVIPASSRQGNHQLWFDNCTRRFLSGLPDRLRAVVMLSTDKDYISRCLERVSVIRPGTRRINRIAYGDKQITWVHVVHFGGQGFNHMNAWLAGSPGKSGDDMRLAVSALRSAGVQGS